MLKHFLHFVFIPVSIFAFFQSYAKSAEIVWNEAAATFGGNGCSKDIDAFAISNGNDMSLIFSNLGFSLTGENEGLAAASNCIFQVPASINSGLYLADLTQTMLYGINKTENTEVTLRNASSFFGFRTVSPEITAQRGMRINNPLLQQRRKDSFNIGNNRPWVENWCKRERPKNGFLRGALNVRGKRDNKGEDLIAFVDGLDIRFEIQSAIVACTGRL